MAGGLDDFLDFLAGRKTLSKLAGTEGDVTQGATPTPMKPKQSGMSQADIAKSAEKQAARSGRGSAYDWRKQNKKKTAPVTTPAEDEE